VGTTDVLVAEMTEAALAALEMDVVPDDTDDDGACWCCVGDSGARGEVGGGVTLLMTIVGGVMVWSSTVFTGPSPPP